MKKKTTSYKTFETNYVGSVLNRFAKFPRSSLHFTISVHCAARPMFVSRLDWI
jgi:hypothetical protein